jgi:hypothetical protein
MEPPWLNAEGVFIWSNLMMNVSRVVPASVDGGPKCLKYRVFVYDDINSKLVEWYSVASCWFKQPEVEVPKGYRVWISSVEDAVKSWQ